MARAPRKAPASAPKTEIPAASGADAKAEGAAAPAAAAEAKAPDEETASGAVDPVGTASAPAAQAEETREQAETASADRKDAAEEGTQPEETALPPVAGDVAAGGAMLVVTGPRKGRWRAGLHFTREPRELGQDSFDLATDEGRARFVAVISDPALRCVFRMADGTERPIGADEIERARAALTETAQPD